MNSAALPGSQSAGTSRDLVFISYSHCDRDWLDRLRVFLKPYIRQNLQIWADPHVEVGGDWRRDIATALSRSCVGVLLVSAYFIDSDFIHDEELPALLSGAEAGEIVLVPIPIGASGWKQTPLARFQFSHPPDYPLDGLPEHERNAALVRISEQIATAARRATPDHGERPAASSEPVAEPIAIVATTGRLAVLHGVPDQRPNYLRRQEYLDRLKQALLGATNRAVGITGAARHGARIGLHGMGGIGKTALAIDVANDDEVRHTFPDGIFWLTLGQTIEPLKLQGELAAYIAGEAKAFATAAEARDHLLELFDSKACLLVLDDLWRPQDAEPFVVLGPRSRLLLTTRDADLLVALGAREMPLDVLSEELALELLASWSGQPRAGLPEAACRVAASCGHLPLALALAGARVQGGARWEEVVSALERGQLEFLDHPYGSVFSSLRLSTDALTESDRARYFELAVFAEDAQIPIAAIHTLWRHTGGLEREASRNLLLRMHRRALLIRNDDGEQISFHDLQHDFLRLNIVSLAQAHAALVDAYRAIAPSGWASGPDDGYFFQELPQHLAAADRLDEVTALLCDYDWLAAKLRATDVTALLADYDPTARTPDLALIQQALRLSTPALLRDGSQLSGQLLGRLRGRGGRAVEALLARAEQGPHCAWLRPRFASLISPGGGLRQILVGHATAVTAVGTFADGSHAISGYGDGTLRLWDLETGKTISILAGHTGSITTLATLADVGAISGSADNTLRLWDLQTGRTLRILEGHAGSVSAVAALADGRRAISGSDDRTLRLWDLDTGKTSLILSGHTSWVAAVAVRADGNQALSGSWDNSLRVWSLQTGETLNILQGHRSRVTAVAAFADGSHALTASNDSTLRLWDLNTGRTVRTLKGHRGSVTTVALLPDESCAISGSDDRTLRLWDLQTGETLRTLEGHADVVTAIAVIVGTNRVLSASADATLRLWDLATGEAARAVEGHAYNVTAVAAFPDGNRALLGSSDGRLRLWDLNTGKIVRIFGGHAGPIATVVVSTDSRRALSGSDDGVWRLWDLESGNILRAFSSIRDEKFWREVSIGRVALLADGSRALCSTIDGSLRLLDLDTGKTLRIIEGYATTVEALAVSANESCAVAGTWDKMLRVWDLQTEKKLHVLAGHTSAVTKVSVSADGSRALSCSSDNTLLVWDLEVGEVLHRLMRHAGAVTAVAVSDDGSSGASASLDHTVRLWDLKSGNPIAGFTADVAINSVSLARNNIVIAGSVDGRAHILEIRDQ
jgi:WD40 repeat protein